MQCHVLTSSTNLMSVSMPIHVFYHSVCNQCIPTGFTANNETTNVTIQSSTVPLRSVNGWLTVMSRVDASFPTGLSFSAYEAGFGNITNNFWLGLTRIYQLTNPTVNGGQSYLLRIELLYSDSTYVCFYVIMLHIVSCCKYI